MESIILYKTGDVFRMYINGQYYGSTFGASTVNWNTEWGNGTGRPCTVIGNTVVLVIVVLKNGHIRVRNLH